MRVLHVNRSDSQGGAARAALRLHKALNVHTDIESLMLVDSQNAGVHGVVGPKSKFEKGFNIIRPSVDQLPLMQYKNKTKTLFSTALTPSCSLLQKIEALAPDIVHLHWINGGMLSLNSLSKVKAPIVWSLHDMWAFTGGCHYSEGCLNFKTHCERCPILKSENKRDLSARIFGKKLKSWSKKEDINIVGLSSWLAKQAEDSRIFRERPVINLPNPIDTNLFFPIQKDTAKEILNISKEKKLILFGAVNAISDPRKGFEELIEALKKVDGEDLECAVLGSDGSSTDLGVPMDINFLGHMHDDLSLNLAYNAADAMVVPSKQENLSNAIMESLSAGTPVISFDIGGNSDLIEHKHNGFLASPYNSSELSDGIKWVLYNKSPELLRKNARAKVIDEFEASSVAQRYADLYAGILNK